MKYDSKKVRWTADAMYLMVVKKNGTVVVYNEDTSVTLYGHAAALELIRNIYYYPQKFRYRVAKRLGKLVRGECKVSCKF